MCRAVPSQLVRIDGPVGWIVEDEQERPVVLLGIDHPAVGDWVFHHAGLALERVDAAEAREIRAALAVLASFGDEETG
jgi:hydrogenase assembly chaperone HypC/HupF